MVLRVFNVFMAEMMNIVRDFGGVFDKNTGDGLMAYLGVDDANENKGVRRSVVCAAAMYYANDSLISPSLATNDGWPVQFRVGIDCGDVTIGRVGVPGGLNSFVAIGSPANIACKLMELVSDGWVCIGELVQQRLPRGWAVRATLLAKSTGFVYVQTQRRYPAYRRLGAPPA